MKVHRGRPMLKVVELGPCAICGDVLGVYEPVVIIDGGGPRVTSQAAESELPRDDAVRYHLACYEALGRPRHI